MQRLERYKSLSQIHKKLEPAITSSTLILNEACNKFLLHCFNEKQKINFSYNKLD